MAARAHSEELKIEGQNDFGQKSQVSMQESREADFSDADPCPLKGAAPCHLAAGFRKPAVPYAHKGMSPLQDDEFYDLDASINQFATTLKQQLREYHATHILLQQLHLFPRLPRGARQPGLECTTHGDQETLTESVKSNSNSHYSNIQPDDQQPTDLGYEYDKSFSEVENIASSVPLESNASPVAEPERRRFTLPTSPVTLLKMLVFFSTLICQILCRLRPPRPKVSGLRSRPPRKRKRHCPRRKIKQVPLAEFCRKIGASPTGPNCTTPPEYCSSGDHVGTTVLQEFPSLPTNSHGEHRAPASQKRLRTRTANTPARELFTVSPQEIQDVSSTSQLHSVSSYVSSANINISFTAELSLTYGHSPGVVESHVIDTLGRRRKDWRCPCGYSNFQARDVCCSCSQPQLRCQVPPNEDVEPRKSDCLVQ